MGMEMATTSGAVDTHPIASEWTRWGQLILGVIAMVMIANYQYGWTFFVPDVAKNFGWNQSDVQVAFTLFVLFETWLVPIEGWFVDRFGPRLVVLVGGALVGLGWWMISRATTLGGIDGYYASMIICGIGAGGVYGTCVGNALKWFPERRGLAAGITAAGFGGGSVLTVIPIQNMIKSEGFQATFFNFGLGQGLVIILVSLFLFAPKPGQVPAAIATANVAQTRRQFSPTEVIGPASWWLAAAALALVIGVIMWNMGLLFYFQLVLAALIFVVGGAIVIARGQPVFILMYFMFVLVGAGGLMVTANLRPIANTLNVSETPITFLWWQMTALTWAASLDRILNGLTRPFFAWVSDHIGRENTMFIAFFLEGVGIYALYILGGDPVLFILLTGMVFFAWGEIYSLFPSTCTDTFGVKFATTNAGLLYTAKGTASLLTPFTNKIQEATGSWDKVLLIAAVANILAAVLAVAALKPWRARVIARS
jgi:OFA family oxalate/formate antiporter-like MFS transporter